MALGTIVNESGFETGLDAGNHRLVDIAFLLFLGGRFNVEVNEFLTINNGDTEFFGLCRVKEHAFHLWAPARDERTRGAPCAGSDRLVGRWMLHGLPDRATKRTNRWINLSSPHELGQEAGICLGRSERVRRAQIK